MSLSPEEMMTQLRVLLEFEHQILLGAFRGRVEDKSRPMPEGIEHAKAAARALEAEGICKFDLSSDEAFVKSLHAFCMEATQS